MVTLSEWYYCSQSLSTWSQENIIWVMISHKLGDLLDDSPPIHQVSTKHG